MTKEIEDKIVNINNEITESSNFQSANVVPYLKTMTMREVIGIAAEQKIQVKFVGSGKVETTYPEQGQPLNPNREITVILK